MSDRRVIVDRRRTYRPDRTVVLLVGESAPAGGTHYYLANSRLFHAIREAARRVYGRRVPEGEDFLTFAQGRGIWLVDLAAQPVNDLDDDARRSIVGRGIPRIAKVIADCAPAFVVAIGTTYVAGPAAQALERSKVEAELAELAELPFPTAWHREEFVEGLARVLRRARRRNQASERSRFSRGLISRFFDPLCFPEWDPRTSRVTYRLYRR